MRIETRRLIIRLGTNLDTQEIINFYKRNEDHLSPWSPSRQNNFSDPEFWAERISLYQAEFLKQKSLRALLFTKEGQLIGRCNFTNVERGAFQNCRLGYMIDHEYQGHGLHSLINE
ncbi:hypothetical protein BIY24_04425 [Halobacteriovorax marinus]|uniref:GNAT family N-acetyltransferase n=1 Tax=Halobacteriovorax marinus TaxID=97084 RepID=UPI000BC316EB|nr:GNAT family N-acetyltransferase [Halobacteriovorax marinus]ATH07209.1 hypothetical protein BIY24_04425 [Halobacteriovorax marinus]